MTISAILKHVLQTFTIGTTVGLALVASLGASIAGKALFDAFVTTNNALALAGGFIAVAIVTFGTMFGGLISTRELGHYFSGETSL